MPKNDEWNPKKGSAEGQAVDSSRKKILSGIDIQRTRESQMKELEKLKKLREGVRQ